MFEVAVKTTYKITPQLIADVLCTLIEGSDVSSWCGRVTPLQIYPKPEKGEHWYAEGKFINESFMVEFQVDDPDKGDDGEHSLAKTVSYKDIQTGLELMQLNHPRHFADMMSEGQWDCITADVFWQLVIFEEVIYG